MISETVRWDSRRFYASKQHLSSWAAHSCTVFIVYILLEQTETKLKFGLKWILQHYRTCDDRRFRRVGEIIVIWIWGIWLIGVWSRRAPVAGSLLNSQIIAEEELTFNAAQWLIGHQACALFVLEQSYYICICVIKRGKCEGRVVWYQSKVS